MKAAEKEKLTSDVLTLKPFLVSSLFRCFPYCIYLVWLLLPIMFFIHCVFHLSLFQSRLIDVTLSNMRDIEGTVVMKVEENVTPHDGLICIGKEILR